MSVTTTTTPVQATDLEEITEHAGTVTAPPDPGVSIEDKNANTGESITEALSRLVFG